MEPTGGTPPDPRSPRVPRWVLPPVWVLAFLLLFCALPWGLSLFTARAGWADGRPGAANLAALALVAAGALGFFWSAALHLAEAPREVAWQWDTGWLLTRGPYRVSRNPLYLAEQVTWLGWTVFHGSWVLLVGLLVMRAAHTFLVWSEEASLRRRFGEAYREYQAAVPRWLGWPRHRDHPGTPGPTR